MTATAAASTVARYTNGGMSFFGTAAEAEARNAQIIRDIGPRRAHLFTYYREDKGAECDTCKGQRNVPKGEYKYLGTLRLTVVNACPACNGRGYLVLPHD